MPTPITDHERAVLAGIFARSNAGMGHPPADMVARAMRGSGNDYTIMFCSEFMETEEHEEMFASEGRSWEKHLKKRGQNTREYMFRVHADIAKLVWPQ